MTILDTVNDAFEKHANNELREEVEYLLDIDAEEQRESDLYRAILDAEDNFTDWLRFGDGSDRKLARRGMKAARLVLIELGVYKPISEEQIRNTVTMGGRKAYDFTIAGVKYVFDKHLT